MIKHSSAARTLTFLKKVRPALALAVAVLLLTGCLFDTPITSNASTNIDTRLLGVFEYKQLVDRDATETVEVIEIVDGEEVIQVVEPPMIIHRVAILPRDEDTYWIYYRNFGQTPAKVLRFIGWISRVDGDYYLSFQDDTAGSQAFGKFAFAKAEWIYPGNFAVSSPNMQGMENAATPYEMRRALRARLKEDTLFPYEPTPWNKIARVYWDRKAENPTVAIPKEFEEGTTEEFADY